jgi:hypothetical protein
VNRVSDGSKVKIYAGTEPAHLFRSDNLGETWYELDSLRKVPSVAKWTFPAPPNQSHVKNIAFDPADSNANYCCVEQGKLFRSKDSGLSWEEMHHWLIRQFRLRSA